MIICCTLKSSSWLTIKWLQSMHTTDNVNTGVSQKGTLFIIMIIFICL